MSTKRSVSRSRKMKPVFLVLCEGETEANYLEFLRQTYRSPIKIISKIEGASISQSLIEKRLCEIRISPNEKVKVFLMYDRDVENINGKLDKCKCEFLFSNPCIELWFILHNIRNKTRISSETCIQKLRNLGNAWSNYEKSVLTETQRSDLKDKVKIAISNAKELKEPENPSSSVYRLLEEIFRSL